MKRQLSFLLDPSASLLNKGSNQLVERYSMLVLVSDGEVPVLSPDVTELLKPVLAGGVTVVDMDAIRSFIENKSGEIK